jgi:hypothetical protein
MFVTIWSCAAVVSSPRVAGGGLGVTRKRGLTLPHLEVEAGGSLLAVDDAGASDPPDSAVSIVLCIDGKYEGRAVDDAVASDPPVSAVSILVVCTDG